jgi:molybdate transport system substrate-binding protein
MNSIVKLSFALVLAVVAAVAPADEVVVAVAANFAVPMEQIAAAFERATGHKVTASYGSTGNLYAQIRNGAPFEGFLAAGAKTPTKLEKEGLAVAGSRFTYAVGHLVLWSPKQGFVDDKGAVIERGHFRKLAIANPKLAPYGAAAVQTLRALGLEHRLRPKLVVGENIAQTYQFVASGTVELGFVALSQVTHAGKMEEGSAWIVPAKMHRPIRQDAVILTKGERNPVVAELMEFLRGEEGRAIIHAFGYGI